MKNINLVYKNTYGIICAGIIYALSAILFFVPGLSIFKNNIIQNDGGFGGPGAEVWVFQWWSYALSHGINPFIEDYTLYPHTQNLAWSPIGLVFPSILMYPITAIFGPIVSYNIWAISSPIMASFSMFLLLRYLLKDFISSVIGGYIFGFSTYEIAEMTTWPQLYTIFLFPLAVLLYLFIFRNEIKRLYFIIFMSVILSMQFCTDLETFATMSFFGISSIAISIIFFYEKKYKILKILILLFLSYLAMSVIVSPYIYYLIIGVHEIPKSFNPTVKFSSDMLNYIIPTPITSVLGKYFVNISSNFSGGYSEETAYLGAPLITIILIYLMKTIKEVTSQLLLLLFFIIFLCSLGPIIHIDGVPTIYGPWAIASFFPLIKQALPMRFTMFESFISSVIVALFVKKYSRNISTYILVILTIFFIAPDAGAGFWKSDIYYNRTVYNNIKNKNTEKKINVFFLPYLYNGPSMLFQAEDNFYYKINDGFIGYNPKYIFKWPLLVRDFYHESENMLPGSRKEILCYLAQNEVDIVAIYGLQAQNRYDIYFRKFDSFLNGKIKLFYITKESRDKYSHCHPTGINIVSNIISLRKK